MNYLLPLNIEGLTVTYQKKPALHDINLKVNRGELVGIIGPNGAGKSTFIRSIMGLIPKTRGDIKVFGLRLSKALKHIGYVPQRESIDWDFPVSVYDVVMMGRYAHIGLFRRPSGEDHKEVRDCLNKVQMEAFADRQISELSGGQQQRIFLARALAQEGDLYFMDEPFAGVDAATEEAIVAILKDLKAAGKTLLVVHHDLASAKLYFDQVLLLNKQVIAYGSIETAFTLENLQKTYEGKLNVFSMKNDTYIAQQDDLEG